MIKIRNYDSSSGDTWEIYMDNVYQWRWRRQASNGRIVGYSLQGFQNEEDCIDSAKRRGMLMTSYTGSNE